MMDVYSSEECKTIEEAPRSISCTGIPEAFLNKLVAKKHFSQFGRIKNFILRPSKFTCIVEYETTNDAENAFLDAGIYNGEQFDIDYTQSPLPKTKMSEFLDPDVQEELDAMAALSKKPILAPRIGIPNTQNKVDLKQKKMSRQIETISAAPDVVTSVTRQTYSAAVEPPAVTPAILSSVDKAAKNELEAIMRKPAFTSEEKFLVLDARDKLIRLTTTRTVDIKRAVSTKGVCPDMCPEKERLMREAQHRVATFELEDGSKSVMNFLIAVKEYSRSSADQESPLPHELRPEAVLKLTMTYLLQNIMDLCDSSDTSICDWFHFLWDRTRSIRKDITQQELCSPSAVLLVEQCARFHIHCAARLIAEEPQVFDQKINTENLTKCLQSLKYMYHDLELKMIRCPNEAEFRAYVVLLNLHDANFLWEVKQLRDEILHSPEIQFAIKVYLAKESNNYVRFFSLVRSTTYMNACILLRYFTQVRVRAIDVICKAYGPRIPVYMSISHLTYTLAFEDFEQCAQFLEYYGLICDRDEDRVAFDRRKFYYPDMPFILERAINVVEHKRHSTVGEAVHGCPLEPKDVLDHYEPHDSFDENGLLLPSAWTADDQNYYKPEARTDARANRSPHIAFREDEAIFKIPTALPRSSPKSRLSPKTVRPAAETSSSTTSIFGTSKFTSVTPSASDNIFKVAAKQTAKDENGLFDSCSQAATQYRSDTTSASGLFSKNSPATNTSLFHSQNAQKDSTDGDLFKITTNTANKSKTFFKIAEGEPSKSNSIFSSNLAQKPESGPNLFSQMPKPNLGPSIFGQSAINPPSVIFENFANNKTETQSFQTPVLTTNASTSLFGGFNSNFTPITTNASATPFNVSFLGKDDEAKRLEEAKSKETQQKQRNEIELARKKQAAVEEEERRKKMAREKKANEEKCRRQKKAEIKKLSTKLSADIIKEFTASHLKEIAQLEIERHLLLEQNVRKIYSNLLDEVIEAKLEAIALEVKTTWDKNILEKYFSIWRSTTRKAIQQKKKIEITPVWLPVKEMTEIVPELSHPLQAQTLSLMKRYRSGQPNKLIIPPVREDTIDLWSIVTPELLKLTGRQQPSTLMKSNIYWKCIISVPDADEDSSCKAINRWLNNIFVRQLSKYPRSNDVFFAEQNIANDQNGQRINVCMRKLSGIKLINELQKVYSPEDTHGTNAVLLFFTTKNLHLTRRRIESVIKATELYDPIGLIIYNLGLNDPVDIKATLKLHDLIDFEKINRCVFSNSRPSDSLYHLTEHALQYVAANSLFDEQLEMQQTVSFLENSLGAELWQRIYLSMYQNPTLIEASTRFDFIADYHNEAVNRLISICSPCTNTPTLFPNELRKFVPKHQLDIPLGLEYFPENWHLTAEKHQRQLSDFLRSLRIHCTIDTANITESSELEQALLGFVRAHIPSCSTAERTAYKMLQHILSFLEPTPDRLDRIAFKEKFSTYSWLHSLPTFTIDLLSFQYQQFVQQHRLPEHIIYDKSEFDEYMHIAWWLQLNEDFLKKLTVDVIKNADLEIDEFEQTRKRQRLDDVSRVEVEKMDLEATLARGEASLIKADKVLSTMNDIQMKSREISKDFDCSLYRQEKTVRDMKSTWKELSLDE